MSVPTEIGAPMLRFLSGRHFWTLTSLSSDQLHKVLSILT